MSTGEDLRVALARLRPAERQALAVRWQENADRWEAAHPVLGRMWQVMTSLVLEVDRLEQLRRDAVGAEQQVMRQARRQRL